VTFILIASSVATIQVMRTLILKLRIRTLYIAVLAHILFLELGRWDYHNCSRRSLCLCVNLYLQDNIKKL
jgi:hypothetical protein